MLREEVVVSENELTAAIRKIHKVNNYVVTSRFFFKKELISYLYWHLLLKFMKLSRTPTFKIIPYFVFETISEFLNIYLI